jgi:hypothetical protein
MKAVFSRLYRLWTRFTQIDARTSLHERADFPRK